MKTLGSVKITAIVPVAGTRIPFSRELVVDYLERRRYRDLYERIVDERQSRPRDLELVRSLRVLDWYFRKNKAA